jgi:membrane fusion protein, copper/silver efflux system
VRYNGAKKITRAAAPVLLAVALASLLGTAACDSGGHAEQQATADTVYTCSMHPQVRQPEPGDCPICGMDLIPAETDVVETLVESEAAEPPLTTAEEEAIWTCSMHPQVRQSEPGDCPICGMDLIPLEVEHGEDQTRRLTVTEADRKLMEVATAPARRMVVETDVPMVGAVTYDERRVERIAARVGGRIERMHVDFEGARVRAGQPMVDLYSSGLIAAQEELLGAARAYDDARAAGGASEDAALATLEAVRERLLQWGLSDEQVRATEDAGNVEDVVTLVAPIDGTVIAKNANEGDYVHVGTPIYTIADLSRVWIELEAYESDLAWISPGQRVTFGTQAHPGRTFEGTVSFIDPVVDPHTRTVGVRVEAANDDGSLRPMMFVRALAKARFGDESAPPLVIPATAPLITGRRAVVYIEVEGTDVPTYEGREVVLGPRAGDYYVVESGLAEGDEVVTEGAFKIDSALQIRAKPSMMSDGGEGSEAMQAHAGHSHGGSH